ncbi:energy transducer TonB [Hydrogenimonas sp.]|uniref:energy transducer TonB n=1 Tax=Hydrogenimonas sp. TaxID=2231112 RepID=UPI0026214782|nr:energy transducer TonB [Hydrogenimonas sp.]
MFDEKYVGRYLFISILITVVIAESLILLYVHLEEPSRKPSPKERVVHVHISRPKPVQKRPEPPKPIAEIPPKPKPKTKPKPKPKPKPKKIIKPKPKPKQVPPPKPTEPEPEKITKVKPQPVPSPPPVPTLQPKREIPVTREDTEKTVRQKALYLQKVRETIEANKYYPRMAKKLRQTGRVEVQFVIRNDGSVYGIEIVKPCRYKKLNRAARRTIEKIEKFEPFPESLNISEIRVTIPINYTLK